MAKSGKSKSKSTKKNNSRKLTSGKVSSESKRAILNAGIPKPSMKVTGHAQGWRVSGLEVLDSVRTSTDPTPASIPVNPLISKIFPRLSGIALQFQRYRFTHLRLHYITAAPATRSGSIGMAVAEEYMKPSETPTSQPALATFQHGSVGTIAASFSTPAFRPGGDEKFFIPSGSLSAQDPLKVFQSTLLFLTADAVEADSGLLAGYIAVEYDVDLYGQRPTLDKVIATSATKAQDFKSDSRIIINMENDDTQSALPSFDTFLSSVGSWALDKVGDYFPIFNEANYNSLVLANVPQQNLSVSYALSLLGLGATRSEEKYEQEFPILRNDNRIRRSSAQMMGADTVYYNPSVVKFPDAKWLPLEPDEKGKLTVPHRVYIAGDVTFGLQFGNPTTDDVIPAIVQVISAGTGAISISNGGFLQPPQGYSTLFGTVSPTGTEVRSLGSSGFQFDVAVRA